MEVDCAVTAAFKGLWSSHFAPNRFRRDFRPVTGKNSGIGGNADLTVFEGPKNRTPFLCPPRARFNNRKFQGAYQGILRPVTVSFWRGMS